MHLTGCGCQKCKESWGKTKMQYILNNKNIKFKDQKTFSGLIYQRIYTRKLSFDFYCEKYYLLIEYDGELHFNNLCKLNVWKDVKKNYYAIKNGFNYLRISYREFDFIESIIEATINKINKNEGQVIVYSNPKLYRETYYNIFFPL